MKTSFPKSKIKAVLVEGVHPRGVEMLEAEGFKVTALPKSPAPAELKKLVKDAHLLGIRSKTEVTPEILEAAPRLLAVGCFCIGTNQVALSRAGGAGVPVFNSPYSNTRSVAELTLGEILALYRRLGDTSAAMHRGEWVKSAKGSHEVRGRTLGIVGYGHIGSQISILAEALGMRVIFYDVLPKLALGNARPVRSLDALLAEADIVTLHVPATAATRGLIGKAQIRAMKPGAMLINNARGSVVDLDALAEALRTGKLGGAALDVFPDEPAGNDEKFVSVVQGLPNVLLTPHIGGSTLEAQASIAEDVCTKLARFVNNGSTTGAVNVPEVELPEQNRGDSKGNTVRRHRILHFHRNVPGVLSKMHTLISGLKVNVDAEYLQTNKDVGYVVLDVAPTEADVLMKGLREIPETIRARMLW